jgi:hypothetical protein
MNRCTSEMEGASNFPMKVAVMEDGRAKVTSLSLPGQEWFGANEESAIRAFRNHVDNEFAKTGLPQVPKWAAEFGAKVPDNDWLKD